LGGEDLVSTADPLDGLERRPWSGSVQVLWRGHWIGEAIVRTRLAMDRLGRVSLVAKELGMGNGNVSNNLRRYAEVMGDGGAGPIARRVAPTNGIDRHEHEHAIGMESSSTPAPGAETVTLNGHADEPSAPLVDLPSSDEAPDDEPPVVTTDAAAPDEGSTAGSLPADSPSPAGSRADSPAILTGDLTLRLDVTVPTSRLVAWAEERQTQLLTALSALQEALDDASWPAP
jgi:hypothetical protein